MASRGTERSPAQRTLLRGTPLVAGLILIFVLALLPSPWSLPVNSGASTLLRGRLATVPTPPASGYSGSVTVELLEGPAQGESVVAAIDQSEEVPGSIPYAKGDEVLLVDLGDESGGAKYAVADRSRGGGILLLAIALALLVVLVAGLRGARALLALCVAGLLIMRFGLPALLSGASPLLVAGGIALTVGTSTTLVTEGFSRRSTAAILGISASLIAVGGLSVLLDRLLAFTPFAGDPELLNLLPLLGNGVDLRGIGLAAALIGTMGIIDDVAATQVAAVDELRQSERRASNREIGRRALRVGQAHIAAVINTLPLAYFAAALPLVVYTMIAPGEILTRISSESIAVEIVRSIVGTAGVLLVMPLSTAAAILVGVGEER
jgi:uncharacterized membrane protein